MSGDDNEPLIGATILQEGTTNGVVTDVDGNYTIEVKDASKATLVISYIGMVTQKHPVNAQTKTLNITSKRLIAEIHRRHGLKAAQPVMIDNL